MLLEQVVFLIIRNRLKKLHGLCSYRSSLSDQNPSFLIFVMFIFLKKCVFLTAGGEVGNGWVTD